MYKDIFEELSFKFRDLSALKPDNIKNKSSFLGNMINEDAIHDFNPSRYSFYIQFMQGLENPELMKKIIYENKLIKSSKEDEAKIIEDIVNKINNLYYVDPMSQDYGENKKKIIEEEDGKINERINNILATYSDTSQNDPKLSEIVKSTFATKIEEKVSSGGGNDRIIGGVDEFGNYINDGFDTSMASQSGYDNQQFNSMQQQYAPQQNMGYGNEYIAPSAPLASSISSNTSGQQKKKSKLEQEIDNLKEDNKNTNDKNGEEKKKYIENADKLKKKYEDNSLLHKYNKDLDTLLKNKDGYNNTIKVNKIKDLINSIDNDEFKSIKNLEISKEDKLVFIGITFLIRIISLALIEWSLNTNFVLNFTQAYLLYLAIYILLLLLIIVIVNITYNLPLIDTYNTDNIFVKIASTFYYFYLMPGNRMASAYRLIAHILLLGVLTTIAILIKLSDSNDNTNINYDYAKKKSIKTTLNNFTLILWVFSSIVALKF